MMSFIVRSVCHPVVHLGETGDIDQVVLLLVGQTSFVTTLEWFLSISGDKMTCEVVVDQHDGTSLLCDGNDYDIAQNG